MWILTYHSISAGPPPLCISAEQLGAQLDFLDATGWKPVPLRACIEAAHAGSGAPGRRCFAVTFDDGYRDFEEAALPVLEARGIPATLFAVASDDRDRLAGGIDAPLLDTMALARLARRGVEIGAHGIDHVDLRKLDDTALARELHEGRERLSAWADAPVESFAYPFGRYDERVRVAVTGEFRAAFTTQLAAVPDAPDPHAIPRVDAFYLDDPWLRLALRSGLDGVYLLVRRWLRRARGSEPRRLVPSRRATGAPVVSGGVPMHARYRPWL